MSLIVSEVYDALIEAGTSADKARAAAAIPVVERLATREDITEVRQDITEVRQDMARLEARLDKKIAVLNLAVFSFGPAMLALLVKLVFFP